MDRHVKKIFDIYECFTVKHMVERLQEYHQLDYGMPCKIKMRTGHMYAVSAKGKRMVITNHMDVIYFSRILDK